MLEPWIVNDQTKRSNADTSQANVSVTIQPAGHRSKTVVQVERPDVSDANELAPLRPGLFIRVRRPQGEPRREGVTGIEANAEALRFVRQINDLPQFLG